MQINDWPSRMKARMEALELTQDDVAIRLNYSRGAITHWAAGRRLPPLDQFSKLAEILEVDPAWLMFGTPQDEVVNTKRHTDLIPIYSWEQISKFMKLGTKENIEANEYVNHFCTDQSDWYALRVKGDSMTAPAGRSKSFSEGDVIIIDPEKTAAPGNFVVALINDAKEATFKQYVIDGGTHYLKPLNPQYPIVEYNENTLICGIIVASLCLDI